MSNKIILFLSVFLILSTSGCKKTGENAGNFQNVKGFSDLPKEFISFYDSFHADPEYQYNHISFPIEGHKVIKGEKGDTIESITWTKKNWEIHKRFDSSDKSFSQEFIMVDDKAVIETISALNGLFRIERRYAKLSDGWNLIYYAQL